MNIETKLRSLRKEHGYNQEDVAFKLDMSTSAYGYYEQGRTVPPLSKLRKLADIYGVSVSELTGEDIKIQTPDPAIVINVYGKVPAGIPIEAIENIEDTEELSVKDYNPNKDYLGLIVDGDSMYPDYLPGDTIIVEVKPDCESGEDCVVYVNGYDATLKTVIKNQDGTITLRPINPEYPPRTYGPNDYPIKILGVVKEIRRKL